MARALMDALDRVRVRRLGDAPDHARLRIAPRSLEVDVLFALDVEVGLVGRLERLGRHPVHPVVNVHELWHRIAPPVLGRVDAAATRLLASCTANDAPPLARPASALSDG